MVASSKLNFCYELTCWKQKTEWCFDPVHPCLLYKIHRHPNVIKTNQMLWTRIHNFGGFFAIMNCLLQLCCIRIYIFFWLGIFFSNNIWKNWLITFMKRQFFLMYSRIVLMYMLNLFWIRFWALMHMNEAKEMKQKSEISKRPYTECDQRHGCGGK